MMHDPLISAGLCNWSKAAAIFQVKEDQQKRAIIFIINVTGGAAARPTKSVPYCTVLSRRLLSG